MHDVMLVEGAGGLLVPLYQKFLFIDLIKRFKLPVSPPGRSQQAVKITPCLPSGQLTAEKIPVAGILINNIFPRERPRLTLK